MANQSSNPPRMALGMGGGSMNMKMQQAHVLSPKLSAKVRPRYVALAKLKRQKALQGD